MQSLGVENADTLMGVEYDNTSDYDYAENTNDFEKDIEMVSIPTQLYIAIIVTFYH